MVPYYTHDKFLTQTFQSSLIVTILEKLYSLDLKKLTMDVKAFDDEESKLKEQIKNQKKIVQDSKPDKGRVKDMEKNCEGLQQIFTDASEKGRDIKDKVKELTKKIKEITSTRVKAVQSKLEKVQGEVEKVKKEITR